ncbi:MAG TPA: YbaB/EbfC family nucleoid-associated protein [Pseudonocardiaceae bacterium]|nr:YbaB/EbfC family nucleoid-associated protein [Pseudonocardiaceae bacterium]
MEPNELMSSYLEEVEVLAQKAETAKKQLKQLAGSLTSGDGAVSLTVNAAGALQNLSFGPKADDLPRAQLAALVVSTARRAQLLAAQQVTAILAPLVGENSDAMRFVQEQIPPPPEPEDVPPASQDQEPRTAYNEEQRDAYQTGQQAPRFTPPPPSAPRFQPPPAPQPVQRQRPRPRPESTDDYGDYGAGPVTREEDW